MVVETDSDRTVEATVSADLAVHSMIEGTEPPHLQKIEHGGNLPELPEQMINLYVGEAGKSQVVTELADQLRQSFQIVGAPRLQAAG